MDMSIIFQPAFFDKKVSYGFPMANGMVDFEYALAIDHDAGNGMGMWQISSCRDAVPVPLGCNKVS
jgi:hypothetical protein